MVGTLTPGVCGPDAMGLPCRHVFHRACLEPWQRTRDDAREPPDCPTCGHRVPLTGESYAADYDPDHMLRTRFEEWLSGGLCECCQAVELEADPPVYLECFDGKEGERRRRGGRGGLYPRGKGWRELKGVDRSSFCRLDKWWTGASVRADGIYYKYSTVHRT